MFTLAARREGFTLVELSIVLVIIGLLIGGILVAQSMIGTTNIQSTIRQFAQYDAAVSNFKTRYNQLPGDTNLMGSVLGDNDGIITGGGGVFVGCDVNGNFAREIGKFWNDLSQGGLKTTGGNQIYADGASGLDITTAAQLANIYIPTVPIGNNTGIIVCGTNAGVNYYTISNFSLEHSAGVTAHPELAFTAGQALAIDRKIDDGIISSGQIKRRGLFR